MQLNSIFYYPIKGLSGALLDKVQLKEEATIPYDRAWALAPAASQIKTKTAQWAFKDNFLNLSRDPKLAQLEVKFDIATKTISIFRKNRKLCQGKLDDNVGMMLIENFLSSFIDKGSRGNPHIIKCSDNDGFHDGKNSRLSLINLESIKDLEERVIRAPINPLRFRGNFYVEGLAAWSERDIIGKTIRFGDVDLKVTEVIERCAATNIAPSDTLNSGELDMNIPLALRRAFDHIECGVFVEVVKAGELSVGNLGKII